MVDVRILIRLFERGFLLKLFFGILFASLLILVDGFALIYFARTFGTYLVLAIEASVSLVGCLIVLDSTRRLAYIIRRRIREGDYPTREYRDMAGCMFAGVLIVVPGIASSTIGAILFLPGLRRLVGAALISRLESELVQTYEHLKLREFDDPPGTASVSKLQFADTVNEQKDPVVQIDEPPENPPRMP